MKKAFILLIVAVLVGSLFTLPASAATEKTFFDDFSNGLSKWSHANNDDNPDNDDKALDPNKSYKVENGQLHIDAAYDQNSFLYLTAEGVKAAEFVISWKMKANITSDSWVGVSVLKDSKDRFNGCNNVLCYFRFSDSGVAFQVGRGYPGGGGVVDLTTKMQGVGLLKVNPKEFHTYQVEYKGGVFKASIDGVEIGVLEYNKLKNPGFISLNACIADVLVDDFKITYSETASAGTTTTAGQNTTSGAVNNTTKPNATSKDSKDTTSPQNTDATSATEESVTDATDTANTSVETDPNIETGSTTTGSDEETVADEDGGSGIGWLIASAVIIVLAAAFVTVYFVIIKPKGGFSAAFKK